MADTEQNKQDNLLLELKKKADTMGVSYPKNITFEKLKAKIDDVFKNDANSEEDKVSTGSSTDFERKIYAAEEAARKPILAIVNDLDSSQQNDPTIIANVANRYFKVGCMISKGKEQLIPSAVIDNLREKQMVQFVDVIHPVSKRPTGDKVAKSVARYNITILDKNPKV